VSDASLPLINGLVDVVLLDGEVFHSRIEDINGRVLTVGAPYGIRPTDIPKKGSSLEIAWVTEQRRHAVDMRLKNLSDEQPPRWDLEVIGSVRLQTRRNYVRGGGGEGIVVAKNQETVTGKVVDISEGGVRLRVREDSFDQDERVEVQLALDNETLALPGTVLFVRRHPETDSFDVIITYQTDEALGRAIRGYVLRREMEERRRLRESVVNAG
jgi:hypothetical protein